ncbi:hypothetical protein C427_2003 [Paraglaciecola psychrophila 170]|uniref:Uncharacterized protein n=1 Tax=Paraglaciecola psychrophila 170 TaxID=1129794 RepID=M4S080_9ALTE|nr:hypothetical protein C427_2003 [Paraglaciecola psychrophila 170]
MQLFMVVESTSSNVSFNKELCVFSGFSNLRAACCKRLTIVMSVALLIAI